MNYKEFLKPNWEKLIIVMILVPISFFVIPESTFPFVYYFLAPGGFILRRIATYSTSNIFLGFLLNACYYYIIISFLNSIRIKFRPDIKKLIITFILLSLTLFIKYQPLVMDATIIYRGFPLFYWAYSRGTFIDPNVSTPPKESSGIIYYFLPFDIIFWYIISCIIVSFYEKRGRKNELQTTQT